MTTPSRPCALVRVSLLAATSALAVPAFAQAPAARDAAPAEVPDGPLEEIIANARKCEENVQDTPISITAFPAEGIEARNAWVVREWEGREAETPWEDALRCVGVTTIGGVDVPLAQFASLPPTRETRGDLHDMALLAGQGIGQIDAVQPVGPILDILVAEAERVITALGRPISG